MPPLLFPRPTRPPRAVADRGPRPPDGLAPIRPRHGRVHDLPFALLLARHPWWVTAVAGKLAQSARLCPFQIVEPRDLAADLGFTRRRVRAALGRLERDGWIARSDYRPPGALDRRPRSVYWLRWRLVDGAGEGGGH